MSQASSGQASEPSFMDTMRQRMNIMATIAGVFTTFAEVTFFRKGFGERYMQGFRPLLVVPLILLWPIFWPQEDPMLVLLLLPMYLISCGINRIATLRRRAKGGPRVHSYYNGVPRLWRPTTSRLDETTFKSRVEPLVMLGMGIAALIISPPLGWFFIWTAIAMGIHANLLTMSDRQQALDLTDAAIDSELLVARAREMRGDVVRVHRRTP